MATTIPLIFLVIVSATLYHCFVQLPVSVGPPRVIWSTGRDAVAAIDANERCEISLDRLEPNATAVYTDALKFALLSDSIVGSMKLEIASVVDSNGIIWGIRFYVFRSGTSTSTLTLVEGSFVSIDNTDGSAAICAVGYRHADADSDYGSTATPIDSTVFTGPCSTTYTVAAEVHGKDGILSTQAATLQLRVVLSQ